VKEMALGRLLGCDSIELQRMNIGEGKDYAELYLRFLEEFSPPSEMVTRLYSAPYVQAFYNESEIEEFKREWTRA
jgi:hypothetical protein|tara:strand:- start:2225 stop:2449 length:225 start_codon:yes stop_codon:yes gene_type:complete